MTRKEKYAKIAADLENLRKLASGYLEECDKLQTRAESADWRAQRERRHAAWAIRAWRLRRDAERLAHSFRIAAERRAREAEARTKRLGGIIMGLLCPYEALLIDDESRRWIAPALWDVLENAVQAARTVLFPQAEPQEVQKIKVKLHLPPENLEPITEEPVEPQEQEPDEPRYVTREMALDAGDPSLEGQKM